MRCNLQFTHHVDLLLARLRIVQYGQTIVTVAGVCRYLSYVVVCRRRLLASVTLAYAT